MSSDYDLSNQELNRIHWVPFTTSILLIHTPGQLSLSQMLTLALQNDNADDDGDYQNKLISFLVNDVKSQPDRGLDGGFLSTVCHVQSAYQTSQR